MTTTSDKPTPADVEKELKATKRELTAAEKKAEQLEAALAEATRLREEADERAAKRDEVGEAVTDTSTTTLTRRADANVYTDEDDPSLDEADRSPTRYVLKLSDAEMFAIGAPDTVTITVVAGERTDGG